MNPELIKQSLSQSKGLNVQQPITPRPTQPTPPKQVDSGIDNDVINLARAIREHESGGNFKAVGDAGTSTGAYQFQPATWRGYAKDVLGDANAPMTRENQNAVAYGKMKEWKDSGLNVAQIAAKWNSGSEKGWENKVGTTTINGKPIKYDVPAYVSSVIEKYQNQKAKNPTQIAQEEVTQETITQTTEQGGYQDIPYISKIPYVGNVLNTASKGVMQTVGSGIDAFKSANEGDITGTGRNILRSASGAVDIVSSPIIGAFETVGNIGVGDYKVGKGTTGILNFLTKPVVDEISDIKSLQDFAMNNPNAEQVISDAINVGGLFFGAKKAPEIKTAITESPLNIKTGVGEVLDKQIPKQIESLENVYYNIDSGTKVGKKRIIQAEQKTEMLNKAGTDGKTPQRILAESGVIPNLDGTRLDTFQQGIDFINSFKEVMNTSKEAIKKVGMSSEPLSLDVLRQEALDLVNTSKNIDAGNAKSLSKEINNAFDSYKEAYGDTIRLDKVDDIKTARFENIFKNKSLVDADVIKKDSDYAIAKAMQKKIESVAEKAGHKDVAQLNRVIGDRIDAGKYLQKIDGTIVKGGRLMKYLTTAIGASAGNTFIGKIIGALTGNAIGQLIISSQIANPFKRLILARLETQNPEAYLKTIEWLKQQDLNQETRLLLEAPKGANTIINQGRTVNEVPSRADYLGKDTVIQSKSPTNQQIIPAITKVNNILDSLSQNTVERKVRVGNISKDADIILKNIDNLSREEQNLLLTELKDIRPKVYKEVIETQNKNRYDNYQSMRDLSMSEKMNIPLSKKTGQAGMISVGDKESLVATHNISVDKLLKANNQGGLANPSMAIFDAKHGFDDFGEISLLGSKDLIKKGKTFGSDVYSPRYPRVETVAKDIKTIENNLKKYEKSTGDFTYNLDKDNIVESVTDSVLTKASYLDSKGIEVPKILNKDGSVDYYDTKRAIQKIIDDKDLYPEYTKYAQNIAQEGNLSERLWVGTDRNGRNKYVPNTLENASKLMNKNELRGGENMAFSGLGGIRARFVKELKSLKDIKNAKGSIQSKDVFQKTKELYENTFDDVVNSLSEYGKSTEKNTFIKNSNQRDAITEFLAGDKSALDYQYTNIPESKIKILEKLKEDLKSMPTEYFETKFKKPIAIKEFKHAVIPNDTPDEVIKILKENNVNYTKYKAGDNADRLRVINELKDNKVIDTFGKIGLNPLTVGAGATAVGAGAMSIKNKKK